MLELRKRVENSVRARRRGVPFSTANFSAPARQVRSELHRLVLKGTIREVVKDLYVKPSQSKLLGEILPPAAEVVKALTVRRGFLCQITGAEAANRLGLSSQVPVRSVYLTNGPSQRLKLGNQEIEIRHEQTQNLLGADGQEGDVFQALRYLGPKAVEKRHIDQLNKILKPETKRQFQKLRQNMPLWMQKIAEQIV